MEDVNLVLVDKYKILLQLKWGQAGSLRLETRLFSQGQS